MESIVVSLAENVLKVSLNGVEGFKATSTNVHPDVVSGTRVLDSQKFVELLLEQIAGISSPKQKKLPLNFMVEPEDVYTHFTTISKQVEDVHEFIVGDARTKLEGVSIEDTYFEYQKIAPFVYQFVAVKKEYIERLIEISTLAGFELKSIVPWVMLLPKVLTDNNPSIFVSKRNGHQIVVLSDLNGIYYSALYQEDKSMEELQSLVHELSVYKRTQPITRVFTVDYDNFHLQEGFEVYSLPIPVNALVEDESYKLHLLYNTVIGEDLTLLETQLNLLNLLPLPAPEKSKKPVIMGAAGVVVLLLLAGGALYFFGFGPQGNAGKNELALEDAPAVLSENEADESTEASESTESTASSSDSEEVVVEKELEKADLSIRVENGAEIAGIAGKTQGVLEELGYTVTGIGNSDDDVRENTLVKFKDSKTAYRELLLDDVKEDFEIIFEDGLDESNEFDVLIVIGTN